VYLVRKIIISISTIFNCKIKAERAQAKRCTGTHVPGSVASDLMHSPDRQRDFPNLDIPLTIPVEMSTHSPEATQCTKHVKLFFMISEWFVSESAETKSCFSHILTVPTLPTAALSQ
jgi:hypothetical protein